MKTAAAISKARIFTGSMLGLGLALLVSACSGGYEADSSSPGQTTVEELGDGTVVLHHDGVGESSDDTGALGGDSGLESSDKRNCVYIQYCKAPDSGRIICRSRDCGCSVQEASDECFRDAKAVCGNSLYMSAYLCGH